MKWRRPRSGVEIFCFDHLKRKMDVMEEVFGGATILGLNGFGSNDTRKNKVV